MPAKNMTLVDTLNSTMVHQDPILKRNNETETNERPSVA